jgi:hypothetical protein
MGTCRNGAAGGSWLLPATACPWPDPARATGRLAAGRAADKRPYSGQSYRRAHVRGPRDGWRVGGGAVLAAAAGRRLRPNRRRHAQFRRYRHSRDRPHDSRYDIEAQLHDRPSCTWHGIDRDNDPAGALRAAARARNSAQPERRDCGSKKRGLRCRAGRCREYHQPVCRRRHRSRRPGRAAALYLRQGPRQDAGALCRRGR